MSLWGFGAQLESRGTGRILWLVIARFAQVQLVVLTTGINVRLQVRQTRVGHPFGLGKNSEITHLSLETGWPTWDESLRQLFVHQECVSLIGFGSPIDQGGSREKHVGQR